jgi:hypothetical protein
MLDRVGNLLKIVCLGLAVLLLVKVVHRVAHSDPLGSASVPPLPKLTVAVSTNDAPAKTATNKITVTASSPTNTNAAASASVNTNATTNASAIASTNTGTNTAVSTNTNASTNTVVAGRGKWPRRGGMPGFGMGGPAAALKLPAPIQTRVDRIKESEILGPFMRPQPMALLGIADDDAFLRSVDGQTGLVKEGGELGGLKLLRIGVNRVLVEQDGEKKELTLFDGLGGESLLPKETNTSTNATATNAAAGPKHEEKP